MIRRVFLLIEFWIWSKIHKKNYFWLATLLFTMLYFHGTILLYSVAPWACENLSQLDIFFFHLFSELPSLLLTGRYLPTYLPYLPVKINEISKLLNN